MKYQVDRGFEEHLMAVAAGRVSLPPAYLVVSKEEWHRCVAEELIRNHLQLERLRQLRWRGSEMTEKQLSEELMTLDLFGDERLLYIEEGESLNKEVQKRLTAYLPRREKTLLILIVAQTVAPASTFYKSVEEHAVVVVGEALRPRDKEQVAERWLIDYSRASNKQMTPAAVRRLYKLIGFSYSLLKEELDKLITYTGERSTIEEEDVVALAQEIPQDVAWQIGELILQNDCRGALAVALRLQSSGSALIALVRQIRRQLQTTFEVATLSAEEIRSRHPQLRDFMVDKHKRLAQSYGWQRVAAAITSLDSCELSFKNGCDDEKLLLTQLMIRLSGGVAPPLKLPIGAAYVF